MFLILASGLMSTITTKREVFPEMDMDIITVEVPYLGAAPEEVEEGVSVRIEEAIQGIDGVKRITSTSAEGMGQVVAELETGADPSRVVDDVKSRVDAIDTFPAETEKPIIREITNRRQVINVAVSGPADETTLKRLGERVRDELSSIEGITLVELQNARPYEISIEVSEDALRRHGLTFDQVARAVRMSSLDLPGGSVKTEGGEVLLRTKGQAYVGREYEDLVLLSRRNGTRIKLGDVATVVDGFAETDQKARFDGEPSVFVNVFRTSDQSALELADAVRNYVDEAH
jgi:multidrug efflux pump subunit AcrB